MGNLIRLNKSSGSFYVYKVPKNRIASINEVLDVKFSAAWQEYVKIHLPPSGHYTPGPSQESHMNH